MEIVIRTLAIYFTLYIVLKIAGNRTLLRMTSFDFILLLIISEATQQAMLPDDLSVTSAIIAIVTLFSIDIVFSLIKTYIPIADKFLDGSPVILVENGKLLQWRLKKVHLTFDDIMEIARNKQGIEHLSQIKFAIMEKNGDISIIKSEN
ncbi:MULTISPECIES: DUF421 domain-containing protein [unclassified Serratia (in: enterobacteria)]|uniref:DUF421 domain-containing protein n=1 Tax=unclassified Serratia (in: enterobacteria) TaxID=2647522 RepID=UPI002ED5788F|nr:YetF domain-containing protein [Serratia sp. C2(2)]MEE4445769.1 YetF domain-containing protein [Serratia sp. C2(1)]